MGSLHLFWPVLTLVCLALPVEGAVFTLEAEPDGVTVKLDGQLFTRYLIQSGAKPILWPIIGPTGAELTRGYPMREATKDEKSDHEHQRSFWFTHGDVNGTSFWDESQRHGKIVHREFLRVDGGTEGILVARNDWIDADEKVVCSDVRSLTFGASGDARWIDFDITIKAGDTPVKFGDTKEGTFGIRVAGTMEVEAGLGGRIVNSAGQSDNEAWGKQASWVDYHGPVGGETVGIAVMNHPSSFRFPTYWHVRTYGLFAANPFGLHNFKNSEKENGSHTLQPGESMTLRYRVYLHRGDEIVGRVADAFSDYVKVQKEP
jgi:hypothetical protein